MSYRFLLGRGMDDEDAGYNKVWNRNGGSPYKYNGKRIPSVLPEANMLVASFGKQPNRAVAAL